MESRHATPQSTSVSRSALVVSVQVSCGVSARQRLVTPSHLPVEQSPSAAQGTPIAQVAAQVAPPQSGPVSTPSVTPFEQEVHALASHCLLVQSLACRQSRPSKHGVQVPPPQSTSVSALFLRLSAQLTQTGVPAVVSQMPLSQSALAVHSLVSAHGRPMLTHCGPPQSTSVSISPLAASVQVSDGVSSRHLLVPLSHLPVEQSLSAPQSWPTMHLPHSAPPQSTSVSADTASLTPLEQEVQTRAWN
jgi:hypothetical protein